jgi:hypothetical protein
LGVRTAVRLAAAGRRLLLTGPPSADDFRLNKLSGLPVAWLPGLRKIDPELTWLVEADGSAGRPVKAHRSNEPVWPPPPYFSIFVLGLSALTRPWTETIHRPEIFALSQPLPDSARPLTPEELLAFTLKASRSLAPDALFLNQADALPQDRQAAGKKLGLALAAAGFRVVSGSLRRQEFFEIPSPVLSEPNKLKIGDINFG